MTRSFQTKMAAVVPEVLTSTHVEKMKKKKVNIIMYCFGYSVISFYLSALMFLLMLDVHSKDVVKLKK